ncbi:MAG: lysylphosphatidylglycerol synthase transmembrane domain-containing protein [Sphingobacteriales bacterium]
MINKKRLSIAVGIITSFIFLAGAFYQADFHEFFLSLKKINLYSLLLCMFFICLSYIARTFMWRITTLPMKKISLSTLFGGIVVGCMVNGVLPFRAGELFRAQYLSSMTGLRRTSAVSTIFIERIMDINSLGCLLVVSFLLGIHGLSQRIVGIVLLIWLIIVVVVALLIINSEKLEKNRHKLTFIPQRLLEIVFHFLAPLNQLRDVKKIIYLVLMSLFSWIFTYLSLFALIYHSGVIMKYEAALLLFLFVNLGFLIPAAPGALGVLQLAFWLSLSRFGVPKEQALALSFAYLFVAFMLNTGVGLPFFLRAHLWTQRKILIE